MTIDQPRVFAVHEMPARILVLESLVTRLEHECILAIANRDSWRIQCAEGRVHLAAVQKDLDRARQRANEREAARVKCDQIACKSFETITRLEAELKAARRKR
jgi:hypothetical protein